MKNPIFWAPGQGSKSLPKKCWNSHLTHAKGPLLLFKTEVKIKYGCQALCTISHSNHIRKTTLHQKSQANINNLMSYYTGRHSIFWLKLYLYPVSVFLAQCFSLTECWSERCTWIDKHTLGCKSISGACTKHIGFVIVSMKTLFSRHLDLSGFIISSWLRKLFLETELREEPIRVLPLLPSPAGLYNSLHTIIFTTFPQRHLSFCLF